MIEIESFIDLHTHTRYPDNNNFPAVDIEFASINGGYSDILAMPNSEIVIDNKNNLYFNDLLPERFGRKRKGDVLLLRKFSRTMVINY